MSDQPTSKRISELKSKPILNDADLIPVSVPANDVFTSGAGSVSGLRKQLNFENAVSSTSEGLSLTQNGQIFHVNTDSGDNFIYEFINSNGIALPVYEPDGVTQKRYISPDAVTTTVQSFELELSSDVLTITDPLGFSHSRITKEGEVITPLVQMSQNGIHSGNIGLVHDDNIESNELVISDGLGFYIPIISEVQGGDGPGEITINQSPHTAAYGLLSKLRSSLEDVCIIINSDSTGVTSATDADGEKFYKWSYKLALFLAENYPAYTVNYYTWSTTSGKYNPPETLQLGSSGKTLYFYNAAVAGTQPQFLMGQYFEKAYVPRQADLLILNHGHNTDYNVPSSVHAGMLLAVAYQMVTRHPNAGVIIFSQNPLRDNDQGTARSNGARQAAIASGFSLVDANALFLNSGKPANWYVDNVHPSSIGDSKIFDLVRSLFIWPSNPSKFTPGLLSGGDLVPNGDFSSWSSNAPDGWVLAGCTAERNTENFESGDFAMKLVATGATDAYAACALPSGLVRRLRGQTVSLACRVYVPEDNTRAYAGHISIEGVSGTRPYGVTSPNGRGGFVWKAITATIPINSTSLVIRAALDVAGGVTGNNCTFDRISLITGNIPQDFFRS